MEKMYTNLTNGGPISVYVKDGKVTRIRPLQIPEEDYPKAWEITGNDGKKYSPPKAFRVSPPVHAERNRLYSDNRILYPQKRVDFDPNGERNPQNRGKSGYERITWDEALDIVSGEIKRVQDKYGKHAVTGLTSSHHNWGVVGYKMGPFARFMNMIEYTPVYDNPDSWEGWHWGSTHTYGFHWRLGMPEQFDLLEDGLQNVEMIVFWSNDPDSTRGTYSGQESAIWRVWLKEKGVKCVFIDPLYNYTAATMDGTWFAPRPGGDTAIAMAIAYVWITEGTYDKEYIKDRTLGFDEFKKRIMGEEEGGYPKTPEWASQESGIPVRKIVALAREWAKKTTSLASGCRGGQASACRTEYGTEWARMMVLLQAMQGLGKPGVSIWGTTMGAPSNYKWFPCYGEPQGRISGADIAKRRPMAPGENPTKQRLFRLDLPDAILDGKYTFRGEGFCGNTLEQQFTINNYPIEGPCKLFYRYGGSFMGTMSDTNKWVKMYQSPELEFVVNQDCWYGGEAMFADIILPACTNLERDDIGEWAGINGYTNNAQIGNNWRVLVREKKAIEPLGESKSDYVIFSLIAERLGFGDEYTEGHTELDWAKMFFETSEFAKDGEITWEEFNEKGYYIPQYHDDRKSTPSLRWFAEGRECDTPDTGNRKRMAGKPKELGTYSGLIEFASESLRQNLPDDEERPIVPNFIPWDEGYKSKMWEKYPFQLITPHPRFSFHTHYDHHADWLNDIPMHRIKKDGYAWWICRIHPNDAKARGIEDGEIVELYNDRGSVLCCASVTYRVPEGVLHSYGCTTRYDPIEPGKAGSTCRAGCVNLLTQSKLMSKNAPGMTPNSCLCDLRKWEG